MVIENSIWLMPAGETRQKLTHLIRDLGQQCSTLLFPPHITLIGHLTLPDQELLARTAELASLLSPFSVSLGAIDYRDDFHQALFVHVEETELLMAANRLARRILDREDDATYMPHLSLLYGDFAVPAKVSIIGRIGRDMTGTFRVDRLHVYSTLGHTRDWHTLGTFRLKGVGKPNR